MQNICVIEDEKDIGESIKTYMDSRGFQTYVFISTEDFLDNSPADFMEYILLIGIYLVNQELS